ncbi:microcin C transport system substrate-binding protein [Desulfobaculum xiamenense]|uniref:Microcin C transport system substrate-binding protein n=1 Tax=Desulfobaculum xiamenense TaxID=995050 RepID=A0A846QJL7_9BACT|nr:extracellular solute-binding protein [Desulfobaculum xiamenense]NJB66672.1 microcin C transport system substrate-binding protein [Desulfobaculum xiamenense]
MISRTLGPLLAILLLANAASIAHAQPAPEPRAAWGMGLHALAIGGAPALPADFTHFPYANPDAPKGGTLRLAAIGTFDSFHPYIARGIAAAGNGLLAATLTTSSRDEPFTQYPYVARSFDVPEDRSHVVFHLDPSARFSDGEPVTADDVIFTFDALVKQGSPTYAKYYEGVSGVTKLSAHAVRFDFRERGNPELPVIAGQLPVLPRHWWQGRDFGSPTLDVPPGCGPYRVRESRTGYSVEYERVGDWWGAALPVNRGRYNFDRIRYDYYRDRTVSAEAFRGGEFDYQMENSAKAWAQDYRGPAIDAGLIRCETIAHERPAGMQGLVFNTRRLQFADRRVREALTLAFDFEWTNRTLFYSQYTRCDSYFSNSAFASREVPSGAELALLEPWRGSLAPEVFGEPCVAPTGDGSGRIRERLRRALALLTEAGWRLEDGVLRDAQGRPFVFEMLLRSPSMERVVLPYAKNLATLGIRMEVSMADASRYVRRTRSFDFDMIVSVMRQSDSPGNEQRFMWTAAAADTPGSRNLAGVKSPVVDDLVEHIIAARDRQSLVAAVRALDRVLLWEHYAVPGWYCPVDRVAYWDRFGMLERHPSRGVDIFSWWYDEGRAKRIAEAGFGAEATL